MADTKSLSDVYGAYSGNSSIVDESEFHKKVLQNARRRLVEDMDPVSLLDYLPEILSKVSVRDIAELPTTSEKNRKIIDCLHSKDLYTYNKFIEYLRNTKQDNLVKCLFDLGPEKQTFQPTIPTMNSIPADKDIENDIEDAFYNNPYYIQSYQDIVKDGQVEVEDRLVRIMIIGCIGQGKTTLARHLIGQPIHTFKSTDGIDMLDKLCYISENGIWEFVNLKKDIDTTTNHDEVKILDDEFLKNTTTNKGTLCHISVWDFGGNFLSYSTQQMFLIRKAIYLLVFDLSEDLQSVHKDDVTDDNKTLEFWIRFWVNSIHLFVGSENCKDPCILLVGTHHDKIKENTQSIFDKVRSLFLGTPLAHHIYSEDFAVSNTGISSDSSISSLRKHIIKVAEERIKRPCIPKRWIPLKIAIIQQKNDNILTITEILKIAKEQKDSVEKLDEVKLFLRYFHEQGIFYYFDEIGFSEFVVVNPKFLMDAFRCIIAAKKSQLRQPALSPMWDKLSTEAKLQENLLQCVWDETYMKHKKEILKFLEKQRVISKPVNDLHKGLTSCSDFYFVPSFLKPDLTSQVQSFRNGKCGSQVSLVYKFSSDVIVQSLYQRVTAVALRQWPLTIYIGKQLIFVDTGVYKISENYVGIIKMNRDELELLVVKLCADDNTEVLAEPCEAFRRYVKQHIDYEFHKIGNLQYKTEKPFGTYIRCNHEEHKYRGSLSLHDVDIIKNKIHCVCPDNQSHSICVKEALKEWFLDLPSVEYSTEFHAQGSCIPSKIKIKDFYTSAVMQSAKWPKAKNISHSAVNQLLVQEPKTKNISHGAVMQFQAKVPKAYVLHDAETGVQDVKTNMMHRLQCVEMLDFEYQSCSYGFGVTNKNQSEAAQESSGKLSRKDLAIVAQLVKINGSVFKLQLGLKRGSVKRIQREFKGEVMQIYQILLKWKKEETVNATLGHLFCLLRKCNDFIAVDWDGIRNLMDDKKKQASMYYILQ